MSTNQAEPWRRRLTLPAYHVGEAARYADIAAQTVAAWHKLEGGTLSARKDRAALSYYQLIEVAVVAAFRRAKFSLSDIRATREYLRANFKSEHPFAEHKFKHFGKSLFTEVLESTGRRSLIKANQAGQLAWEDIVGPLLQVFDYEHDGIVIKWQVAGVDSPIIIDPRIAFGAPTVGGTPTWIIKGRFNAGEHDSDIAEDFGIQRDEVREALKFEGVLPYGGKSKSRLH